MYWIAINQASCAMCSIPVDTPPTAKPTPQFLVGFPSLVEAQSAMKLCLTAPIAKVQAAFMAWTGTKGVVVKKCRKPQKPAATTYWEFN